MSTPPPSPLPVAESLWASAQQHVQHRRFDAATRDLQALLARHPGQAGPHMLLAAVVLAQGRMRDATEHMKAAAIGLPDDLPLLISVAQGLSRLGEVNTARATLRHPAIERSRSGAGLTAIGHVFQGLGLHEDALRMMDRARALGYDNPDFRYFRALQLQFNGRLADAAQEMEHCLRLGPTFGRASLSLARIRKQSRESNHVDFIRARLDSVAAGSEDHAAFEFALSKELEDLGELDDAWAAMARANAIMAARLPYDVVAESRLFDALIGRFSRGFLARRAPRHDGPQPVFIVGMPRSGTTLLERILGNHSMVASAGELPDFAHQLRWVADRQGHMLVDIALLDRLPDVDFAQVGRRYLEQSSWRAGGRAFYVDKLPPNFMLVGAIHKAFPDARVIHVTRDPMDVCFSNFRAMFGDSYAYSYDLARLAHHHGQYGRLMRHWRQAIPETVLDLPYADLVQDTEVACRRVLDFCQLPFEAACLDPTLNTSSVATLSTAQVRQPIHARGLGEWRRYEAQLQPLREMLGATATP